MESVPFLFCDEVCAVMKGLYALVELTSDDSICGIWKEAAEAVDKRRVTIQVNINCKDGVWSYSIKKSYRIYKSAQNGIIRHVSITFQELKAISTRCVETSAVRIGCSYGNLHISTLNEVKEILKYSVPSVNLARMQIATDEEILEIPEDILTELLSPFCNSSFSEIYNVIYSKAAEDFLRTQMESESLSKVVIKGHGWSDELRVAIQRFALTKPFFRVSIVDDPLGFSLKFIKKFFKKACKVGEFSVAARFDVDFERLRRFDKKLQIHSCHEEIVWRRTDGVEVKIKKLLLQHRLSIKFSCGN